MSDKELLEELNTKVMEGRAEVSDLAITEVTLLLKLANRLKKYKRDHEAPEALRLAVLGSYSIQHFTGVLDVFLKGMGIDTVIYEGEYDGIRMDVLDRGSAFYAFKPQVVLLMMDHRDVRVRPAVLTGLSDVQTLADEFVRDLKNLWGAIKEGAPGCSIFQTNFPTPIERPLGNLEGSEAYSLRLFLSRINLMLAGDRPDGVSVIDMEYISSCIGKKAWFDYPSYFLTKAGFSPDCLPRVAAAFARSIGANRGKIYKCLVMDLDNTIWGGVVGDDGYDGIELDPHNAVGEAYRHFQKYVLELKKRGVILAVCSKNDEEVAKEPFEKNRDMILSLEDISCFIANWEDKARNIKEIARRLNIGTDSLVFVDDNPAERQIVRTYLPEVLTVELPEDPAYYATALEECDAFSWASITPEDISRVGTYAANAKREELMDSFVDYDEYLRALEMSASLGEPEGAKMKRFAQLINKSNQFNLRTVRYSEEELEAMKKAGDTLIYTELEDRFSEYGIISCIILKKQGEECFVDTWLMSCRVLKRGVEYLDLDEVVKKAKAMGCSVLVGEYIPTKKNGMVRDFFPSLGFKERSENIYELKLSDYKKMDYYIDRR
ncbi:MAG: HAD family hydrolase [Lachnospiraceae bacterium]|nr:HAD family hydrolase [Lachnospiraceae bacterium]